MELELIIYNYALNSVVIQACSVVGSSKRGKHISNFIYTVFVE